MTTNILRNSTLLLILALLAVGAGKSFAQSVPTTPPTQPSPDGGPNPNCTPGVTCLAIH